MAGGQLNVVLHGMWAVIVTSECLEVLAPRLPNHTVGAVLPGGVNLQPLKPRRSYPLTGVDRRATPARFPREKSLVVENLYVINRAADAVFCSIYLPHAANIDVHRKVKVEPAMFLAGSHGEKLAPRRISLIHTLVYNYTGAAALSFGDIRLAGAGGNANYSLHLFSEPSSNAMPALTARHACDAFDGFSRIFPGLDLQLKNPPWAQAGSYSECSLWERQQAPAPPHPFVPPGQQLALVPLVVENV
jgi:hypothetical protein